ncbi:MAG: lactate racemase domain-containing protein [Thermoplasmata archaeon]
MYRAPPLEYAGRELRDYLPESILREGRLIPLIPPPGLPEIKDVAGAFLKAVTSSSTPDRCPSLKEILEKFYKGGAVAIIVDDHTRTNHHTRLLLPHLLNFLLSYGVGRESIRLVVATGTHRAPLEKEMPGILGSAWPEYRDNVVIHNDKKGLARVGTLDDGSVVEVNNTVFSSEVCIPLNDLEYHYFAGIAGGPKQICPGVCGAEIIRIEHLKMFGELGFAPGVESGSADGNPVFEYKKKVVGMFLDEMRKKGSWVYALTAVMDPEARLVWLEGGDLMETHRRAFDALGKVYIARVREPADVVIISARQTGINLYQSGKAYNAAKKAVKKGGHILLLSECRDGFGNEEFKGLMAVSAPIFHELEARLGSTGEEEAERLKNEYIDRAMRETQMVVMSDFKIGKQKPVDLLDILKHTGYGHLWIIQDGLKPDEERLVPLVQVGNKAEPVEDRLRRWIEQMEHQGKPTYCVIPDPNLLVRAGWK